MYKFIRKLLFLFPPEWVHYFSMNALGFLCSIGFKGLIRSAFKAGEDPVDFQGILFKNRVGLGAGFDKNAIYLRELECLGFGFVEIGTVTPLPQTGNDKPRLFRLPKDKAFINRMGFNNDGVKAIAARLKKWRERPQPPLHSGDSGIERKEPHRVDYGRQTSDSRLIIGGNIGKNKSTPNELAWKDYEICFRELHPYVDYFVVNVSSPNTPGLRELQEKESLRKILSTLQKINSQRTIKKPLLLKISPELSKEQIDDVLELAIEIKLDGLVATNTTIDRTGFSTPGLKIEAIGMGGLSGLPLKERSTATIRYIHEKTNGQIPVIGSGGIFNGADAKEKLDAGASLVQVWTGFIYEGPGIVKKIVEHLKESQIKGLKD